jgi:hypothetical protein
VFVCLSSRTGNPDRLQNCTCPRWKGKCNHALHSTLLSSSCAAPAGNKDIQNQGADPAVCYSNLHPIPVPAPIPTQSPTSTPSVVPSRAPTLLPTHSPTPAPTPSKSYNFEGSYSNGIGSYGQNGNEKDAPSMNCDPNSTVPCTCAECCFPFVAASSRCSECLLFTTACRANLSVLHSRALHSVPVPSRSAPPIIQANRALANSESIVDLSTGSDMHTTLFCAGSCSCEHCCAPYVAQSPALCNQCNEFTKACLPATAIPSSAPTNSPSSSPTFAPTGD